jgi:hypothetical protein
MNWENGNIHRDEHAWLEMLLRDKYDVENLISKNMKFYLVYVNTMLEF